MTNFTSHYKIYKEVFKKLVIIKDIAKVLQLLEVLYKA